MDPNFLIVGGARCGSTALARFVAGHPDVFVARQKECSYFVFDGAPPSFEGPGDDYLGSMVCTDPAAYEAMFADAGGCAAVGEASVYYLQQGNALEQIAERLPGVKIIAILRDPVDRAFSAWSHHVRDGREHLSFTDAIAAEDRRRAANWEWAWSFVAASRYSADVARIQQLFAPDQYLLLRYDEFEQDGAQVLRRVFDFLGVDPTVEIDTDARINPGGMPRSRRLQDFVLRPHPLKDRVRPLVPTRVLERAAWLVVDRNTRALRLDPSVRVELLPRFAQDVEQLEQLTGWDLTAWRS